MITNDGQDFPEDEIDEVLWFDRKVRAYLSACVEEDAEAREAILLELESLKENPLYTWHLMSTFGAVSSLLLSVAAHTTDAESLQDAWMMASQSIELDILSRYGR